MRWPDVFREKMTDAAGVSFTSSRTVNLPKVVKKHKKN